MKHEWQRWPVSQGRPLSFFRLFEIAHKHHRLYRWSILRITILYSVQPDHCARCFRIHSGAAFFFFLFFFPKSGCVTLLSLSFGSLLNSWTLNKDAACQSKTLSHSLYSHYRWAGIHNRNKNHNRGPVISGTCYENTKKCKKKLLQKQRFLWLVLSYKKKERKKSYMRIWAGIKVVSAAMKPSAASLLVLLIL